MAKPIAVLCEEAPVCADIQRLVEQRDTAVNMLADLDALRARVAVLSATLADERAKRRALQAAYEMVIKTMESAA